MRRRGGGLPIRVALCGAIVLSACRVGPNYKTPPAPVPPAFKEPPPESFKEWKQAHPADDVIRGKWWEIYHDPALNALEEQVNISNQNVLAAEASYRQALAAIRVARSALGPTFTATPGISAAHGSSNLGAGQVSSVSTLRSGTFTTYTLPFGLSWTTDIWGSIRRGITAARATAQASAAGLESARLAYQSMLAEDYFEMRGLDAQQAQLSKTVADYREFLQLTQYRYQSGIASEADIAAAKTQLDSAEASLIDTGVARAQYEHAIAVLTGRPPAEYSAEASPLNATPPPVPVALPSELLERRPDIAAAERNMAAANEQIGIAKAAYFPSISLSASAGLESSSILNLLNWPSHFWSVGPQAAETLLDFGRRAGAVQEAQSAYEAAVANYRQTVLTAFQGVEDNLAALRILEQEYAKDQQTIADARESLRVTMEQYQAGTANYLQVLTAQTALLSSQTSAIAVLTRRMSASVLLIQALGGGWSTSELPKE
ncbi:MAG TPA: efflux transporter outer membrane subunit [Bryobacteraceae bacterium]|jgi:NodT family efflux transporter outer membrane factor (OMF) lipoprotein|nr:efflux transporter outer membrane subunit [Bryobacteraceae bacterium]